jgi:hypothetical protein
MRQRRILSLSQTMSIPTGAEPIFPSVVSLSNHDFREPGERDSIARGPGR